MRSHSSFQTEMDCMLHVINLNSLFIGFLLATALTVSLALVFLVVMVAEVHFITRPAYHLIGNF